MTSELQALLPVTETILCVKPAGDTHIGRPHGDAHRKLKMKESKEKGADTAPSAHRNIIAKNSFQRDPALYAITRSLNRKKAIAATRNLILVEVECREWKGAEKHIGDLVEALKSDDKPISSGFKILGLTKAICETCDRARVRFEEKVLLRLCLQILYEIRVNWECVQAEKLWCEFVALTTSDLLDYRNSVLKAIKDEFVNVGPAVIAMLVRSLSKLEGVKETDAQFIGSVREKLLVCLVRSTQVDPGTKKHLASMIVDFVLTPGGLSEDLRTGLA